MKNYHLSHDGKQWTLKQQGASLPVEKYGQSTKVEAEQKAAATLKDSGSSLKIHNLDGKIAEERTYPRSADPKKSPG